MDISNPPSQKPTENTPTSKTLLPYQIEMIEQALKQIGEYGEVRLIVEKGKLRYIQMAQSLDVLKTEGHP